MFLKDFLMLAAVTSRSRCYLQKLIEEKFFPSFVLLVDIRCAEKLPGQQEVDSLRDLQAMVNQQHIPVDTICADSINDKVILEKIRKMPQKYIIYSGYGGAILQKEYFELRKEILHVHGGRLPEYRGSTTVYYQMLSEEYCTATALFLKEKIDAGPILLMKNFPHPSSGEDVDYDYGPRIRAEVLVDVIKDYVRSGKFTEMTQEEKGAESYYIIHPVLRHLALLKCPANIKG